MKHTTQDGMVIEAGARIYYTGDSANLEREGTVRRVYADKWGTHVELELDAIECGFEGEVEPARVTMLSTMNFEPAPGRRFMTCQKRAVERAARIEAFKASMVK